ncbi:putative enterotoxin [Ophiocordyceps camponoti-floridani]|uniref:Putative enterotoxin n=1 Tax=Ophiocordyceps camponoti-floridani TaxID=2030778 RepID=A0A8H4Q5T1_9HYPO|nr:putative enterotoxin [Ophiocordyceps camponoti-floridani]
MKLMKILVLMSGLVAAEPLPPVFTKGIGSALKTGVRVWGITSKVAKVPGKGFRKWPFKTKGTTKKTTGLSRVTGNGKTGLHDFPVRGPRTTDSAIGDMSSLAGRMAAAGRAGLAGTLDIPGTALVKGLGVLYLKLGVVVAGISFVVIKSILGICAGEADMFFGRGEGSFCALVNKEKGQKYVSSYDRGKKAVQHKRSQVPSEDEKSVISLSDALDIARGNIELDRVEQPSDEAIDFVRDIAKAFGIIVDKLSDVAVADQVLDTLIYKFGEQAMGCMFLTMYSRGYYDEFLQKPQDPNASVERPLFEIPLFFDCPLCRTPDGKSQLCQFLNRPGMTNTRKEQDPDRVREEECATWWDVVSGKCITEAKDLYEFQDRKCEVDGKPVDCGGGLPVLVYLKNKAACERSTFSEKPQVWDDVTATCKDEVLDHKPFSPQIWTGYKDTSSQKNPKPVQTVNCADDDFWKSPSPRREKVMDGELACGSAKGDAHDYWLWRERCQIERCQAQASGEVRCSTIRVSYHEWNEEVGYEFRRSPNKDLLRLHDNFGDSGILPPEDEKKWIEPCLYQTQALDKMSIKADWLKEHGRSDEIVKGF